MTRPTRQEILQATSDQLNQWTAEHVMGWISVNGWSGAFWQERRENGWRYWFCGSAEDRPESFLDEDCWFPCQDWNAAMMVRSKLTGSQFSRFVNHLYEITGRIAAADKRGDIALFSTLEPFIVCQAALLAVCGGDETNKEMK